MWDTTVETSSVCAIVSESKTTHRGAEKKPTRCSSDWDDLWGRTWSLHEMLRGLLADKLRCLGRLGLVTT